MSGVTVLLVEDDPLVKRVTERMLHRLGHKVVGASSPSEALSVLASYPDQVDLVLTDVQLPEMPGPDLVVRLLALRPTMRVIIMSGAHVTLDPAAKFVATILPKPFLTAALDAKMKEALA